MGAITVGPEVRLPKMCAGRGAVNVTIASARATAPVCSPMTSASAPDGMSTAIIGALAAFIFAIACAYKPLTGGRNPLPRIVSIRTSQSKTCCAEEKDSHPLKSAKEPALSLSKGGAPAFLGAFVVAFFAVLLGNFAKFAAASPRNSDG